MFRAGASSSSRATGCSRVHCQLAPDRASPIAPPNYVQVLSSLAGWKKQPLMLEMSKALKSVSSNLIQRFIDSAYSFSEMPVLNQVVQDCATRINNWKGNFRPIEEIGEAVLLNDIEGEVPEDFPEGIYVRNGPNPLNPMQTTADSIFGSTSYTHFEGQGMLHAVYFHKSNIGERSISYMNKYVKSDTFELERQKGVVDFIPAASGQPYAILLAFVLNMLRFGKPVKDSANTSIIKHAGRYFALAENHLPYEIGINTLETLAPYDVNGAWDQPFTSHPKTVPGSGQLLVMGINAEKPYYLLGVISSDGEKLLHKVDLKFKEPRFIHDIGVTEKYNIIMDYPNLFGVSRTLLQRPLFENDMKGKSRIGVMPRFGNAESIMWFDVENHCSFHLINCFEDGNEVIVRGCRTLASVIPGAPHNIDKSKWNKRVFFPPDKSSEDFDPSLDGILFSRPYEWRLNLEMGTTTEGYIMSDKFAMDFPVVNEKFTGIRNTYGYAQVVDSLATSENGLFKYSMIAKLNFDVTAKENSHFVTAEYHVLKEKQYCPGVQFVAKKNGIDEDDGWVITYVHDEGSNISQAYIIDAKRFGEEPIAKITLPQRVPYGFHCNFFYK